MPYALRQSFDRIRRIIRGFFGYRSPVYIFASAVSKNVSLVLKEGIGTTIKVRRLSTQNEPSEHVLKLSRLLFPITVRGGTDDVDAVINNAVREEYGLALPPNLDPRHIIDAGAFIGDTSAYFLSRYTQAKLISLEPNELNFALAERNLKPYGSRVQLLRAAVWWKNDVLRFSGESLGGALSDSGHEVQALAVGDLINSVPGGRVDILKLDVEGAEDEIFLNSPGDWLPQVDHILIELHGPEIQSRVLTTLQKHGFICSPYRSIWCCSRHH